MLNFSGRSPMKQCLLILVLAGMMASLQGCNYARNRYNDALDVIEAGITISTKPQIAAYVDAPFVELFPIGYSDCDGYFLGIGGGNFRLFSPFYETNYGGLIYGQESRTFDYGKADLDKMSEADRRRVLITHHAGIGGVIQDLAEQNWPDPGKIGSWPKYFASCPHYIHLGFIGAVGSVYYWEPVDFIVGFTTLDLSQDDNRWENKPELK